MAERDATAKHERLGAGRTILDYLDLLAGSGYEDHPGDTALRQRYAHAAAAYSLDVVTDNQEDDDA
jgi:hypothetical protein